MKSHCEVTFKTVIRGKVSVRKTVWFLADETAWDLQKGNFITEQHDSPTWTVHCQEAVNHTSSQQDLAFDKHTHFNSSFWDKRFTFLVPNFYSLKTWGNFLVSSLENNYIMLDFSCGWDKGCYSFISLSISETYF